MEHRISYLDNIKIFLTVLVIAHHAAQPYGPSGGFWFVDDPLNADYLSKFFFINAAFMMGLFFFISGYFIDGSIERKGTSFFLKDRIKRLGIPFVLLTLLVFLPFNYLRTGENAGIINCFITTYFNTPPIGVGHLWFLSSLFLYTLIYLLYRLIKTPSPKDPLKFRPWYIFVYIIVLTFVTGIIKMKYQTDKWVTWIIPLEVAHLPQYLSMFFIGIVFRRNNWLNKISFGLGISYLILSVVFYVTALFIPPYLYEGWPFTEFIEAMLCVGLSLGLIVLFRKYLNVQKQFTQKLALNSYGVYLIHLFVVIMMQYLILKLNINATTKFLLTTIVCTIICFSIIDLIRKNKLIKEVI